MLERIHPFDQNESQAETESQIAEPEKEGLNKETAYPKEITRGAWRINYGEKFHALRDAHPNIISTVEDMIDTLALQNVADYRHRTIVDSDISLTLLNEKESKRHYSLELPEGHFFLKEVILNSQIPEGGVDEYQNAEAARQLLKDIPGVAVVEYVFGFSNREKNYIVTTWNSAAEKNLLRTLEEFASARQGDEADDSAFLQAVPNRLEESIRNRIEVIKNRLADFRDVTPMNMAYDKATDTVIVFDINKGTSSLIESSDDDF